MGRKKGGAGRRQRRLPGGTATSQSVAGCERGGENVSRCRFRNRRDPDQRRQPRLQARHPPLRDHGRPGRYRRHLLRRPRPRNRRRQLHDPGRCAARLRPRRRGRGDPAGTAGLLGGRGAQAAPDHPRCLPRQSLRSKHAPRAQDGEPRRRRRPRQGGADQHRHADRLCGEGGFHRRRRQRRAQPLHHGRAEKPHRAWPRRSPRLRAGEGRGLEGHRQPAGAVRLRIAGRRQHLAGGGPGDAAGSAGLRRQGRLRTGAEDRLQARLGGLPRHPPERLLRRSRPCADRGDQRGDGQDPARRAAAVAAAARDADPRGAGVGPHQGFHGY